MELRGERLKLLLERDHRGQSLNVATLNQEDRGVTVSPLTRLSRSPKPRLAKFTYHPSN